MIRFHKSFKLLSFLHLNVSKTGVSLSIGKAPFTINVGDKGAMVTTSLPGTGLSDRTFLKKGSGK